MKNNHLTGLQYGADGARTRTSPKARAAWPAARPSPVHCAAAAAPAAGAGEPVHYAGVPGVLVLLRLALKLSNSPALIARRRTPRRRNHGIVLLLLYVHDMVIKLCNDAPVLEGCTLQGCRVHTQGCTNETATKFELAHERGAGG